MAEEDLIFGKNRHFFGGIEPSNMLNFQAALNYIKSTDTARIKLTAKLPLDTVVAGQTLCTVAGAVIRRSTDGYPEDEFSGDLIANITEDSTFYDLDVEIGQTYYYAAFPYTKQGVYNRNKSNRACITARTYTYFFGYDRDLSNTDPASCISYPDEVENADFESAYMDFANGKFVYGGWPNIPGDMFMPRPCMLQYNGVVYEYLDPDNYALNTDGEASQVANTSFGGNAMVEWPKIYTYRTVENGIYKFRCSDIPITDEYDCWCNYDINNNEIDHFYTPIYFGSNVSSVLRSISGCSNLVSATASTEITYATANGDGWYTEVLADRLLIQDLLVMMAKTTNTQLAYGYGRCASGNTSAIGQGTMNSLGMFFGYTNQTSGVKVFGMENWWGNLWRRTAGWINDKGTQKIKITRGTHDGSTAEDYNTTGDGYIAVEGSTPSGTSGGYISACVDTEFGRIPCTASGSSTTNEADGLWFNNSQVDYALCGGHWVNALRVGAFAVDLYNAASYTHAHIGAALSCKPLAV